MENPKSEGHSGQQPAEGSDDLPPPTEGSPVHDEAERNSDNQSASKAEKDAARKTDDDVTP